MTTTSTGVLPLEIDNAEDHMDAVADMLEHPVHVTELLGGRDWAVQISRVNDKPTITVCKFGDTGRAIADEKLLFDQHLDYMLQSMFKNAGKDVETITIRGVVIDAERYGRKGEEVRLYDIEVDGQPMDARQAFALFFCYAVPIVPVLSLPDQTLQQWLGRRSVKAAATGMSKLAPVPRLGVVFRPMSEFNHPSVGRLLLKSEAA